MTEGDDQFGPLDSEGFNSSPPGFAGYDITGVQFTDLAAWMTANVPDPTGVYIDYLSCGSHTVALFVPKEAGNAER